MTSGIFFYIIMNRQRRLTFRQACEALGIFEDSDSDAASVSSENDGHVEVDGTGDAVIDDSDLDMQEIPEAEIIQQLQHQSLHPCHLPLDSWNPNSKQSNLQPWTLQIVQKVHTLNVWGVRPLLLQVPFLHREAYEM